MPLDLLNSSGDQIAKKRRQSRTARHAFETDVAASGWLGDRQFPWLRSAWNDAVWQFNTVRTVGQRQIRWDDVLCDGSRLTDRHRVGFLEIAKTFVAALMENPLNTSNLDYSTAIARGYAAITIIDFAISRGHARLDHMPPSDWEIYKGLILYGQQAPILGTIPPGADKITSKSIEHYFRVWEHFHDFYRSRCDDGTRLLEDGIAFDPFPHPGGYSALARLVGVEVGRTPDMPVPIALQYLNTAIVYIADYAPDILMLRNKLELIDQPYFEQDFVSESKRPNKDEIARRLALHSKNYLDDPSSAPIYMGTPSKPKIASEINVSIPPLYSNPLCVALFDALTLHVQASSSGRVDLATREALSLVICETLSSTKPQDRSMPARRKQELRASWEATALGLPFEGQAGAGAPWPILSVSSSRVSTQSLENAESLLWSAIFIVIAAFMADRLEEVLETRVDCITTSPNGSYLRNTTWKARQTDGGVQSSRPCPAIVVKAVEVATSLGQRARSEVGSDRLFMARNRLGNSVPDVSTIRWRLKTFGRYIGIPADETGKLWETTPHELRRFFAFAWVWQNEFRSFSALRRHLRHTEIETTIRYATNQLQGEAIGEEIREMTAHVIEGAAFDGLDVTGPLGEHFKRLFSKLRLRVVKPEKLSEYIGEILKRRNLSLRPTPWGYCGWAPGRAGVARCAIEAGIENPTGPVEWKKCPETCGRCPNFLTHSGFEAFWRSVLMRHSSILAMPGAPPILAEAALDGIHLAQSYLSKISADQSH